MSILRSLYSGASGIAANGAAMSVAGDNIANVNTVGFKAGRATFEDILAQSVLGAGGVSQVGRGARLSGVEQLFLQGALSSTENPTDLAISGGGFFVVRGRHLGAEGLYFTRAGQFHLDRDGYLVNPEGLRVQGYSADPSGLVGVQLTDLRINGPVVPPRATTSVLLALNLDAGATTPAAAWDPQDPATTSNFQSAVTVYDSLGQAHQAEVYFRKTAAGQWEWHALVDGAQVTGGTAGQRTEIAAGTLTFDANGRLTAQAQTVDAFNPTGAANPQPLAFDFTDTVQFAAASTLNALSQDGFSTGQLTTLSVDPDGVIRGGYSNGQVRTIGRVALASFAGETGLRRVGGNLWSEGVSSGQPLIGAANAGGRGSVVSGALEQSNVDLVQEFISMIAAQRGYQASSRVISTGDAMLAEVVNLRR